jgi:ABC-type branched-subunit amino acid transport system substrate-binding protein
VSVSHRRLVAVSLVVALMAVVAGCSRSSTTDTAGTSTTAQSSASSGAPGNGQFGSITTPVCGPKPSGGSTGTTVKTGATSGPNVQGVSSSSIRLGVISDVGYSGYPGLNQELYDASDVFVDWCNSLGGINGHKIQLDKLDAKLLEYKAAITQACSQEFALVGGGGVFDNTGQVERLSCLLPDFPGYVVTPEARGADLEVQATNGGSNTAVNFGLARYLDQKFPSAGNAVGYLTANTSTTITNKDQYQEAGASFGWKTVYDAQYNALGEPTWLPFAQAIKDKGTKGLYFVGSAVNLAHLINSLAQINYKLDWVAGPQNMYDPQLIALGGNDLNTNNVYINDATTPFTATEVPAIPQYEELFDKYLPKGLKTASLGLNSFAAWLLFAQAAKACGDHITRLCVYENGIHTTSFDGGGLSGKLNPSTPEVPTDCFVPVLANPKGFSIIKYQPNDGPYNCSPQNVVKLTGDYGKSVKFSDTDKSLSDLN